VRIVCLDGYTLNPGDLSWSPFESLGEFTTYDRTAPAERLARARGAEAVLTNKVPLDRETLSQLEGLRYVGVLATGTNVVDLAAARELGIAVTNVPGYGTAFVAQHTFALLLALIHRVERHDASVREGAWSASKDFCYSMSPLSELEGKTLGLVGYGAIGRRVGDIGRAFGMRVVALERPSVQGIETLPLDRLLAVSDVVSLHTPLTKETERLVGREFLEAMKPGAYLLNTSRGGLIDEPALLDALRRGRIAGAGLDVLSAEPPPADHPLVDAPNCVVTPHIAWAAFESRRRLMQIAADNLRAFVEGVPRNLV
jgi:glycerate dehydrogenase